MEIPYTVTARPDTGLWNAKVGIWLFLASEVMLFGGLFSSYIFLRLGADYPWPKDELQVGFGFVNTLVLIASSVFVVYAWVALKMRQWAKYRIWMCLVVISAAVFLVNKSFEYKNKLIHYHARLVDGTVVSGHLDHDLGKKAKSILFDASHVVVDAVSGSSNFLKYLENKDDIRFTTPDGKEVNPTRGWFRDIKKGVKMRAEADRLAADGDTAGAEKLLAKVADKYPLLSSFDDSGQMKMALSKTGNFVIPRHKVLSWKENEMDFTRALGTKLEGKLVSAELKLAIDELDMRVYLRRDDPRQKAIADSTLFNHFDDEAEGKQLLEDFRKVRGPKVAAYEEAIAEWKAKHPGEPFEEKPFHEFDRSYLNKLHDEAHGDAHEGDAAGDHEVHAATGGGGGHAHPHVTIPFEDVKFFSNFGPRKNTYNAIYFTMTGLHGLHVLGGMLVLGYFLLFGRKLYLQNPEHMANRVEVGGLFWHFVDLVWIFLFPIFYLM